MISPPIGKNFEKTPWKVSWVTRPVVKEGELEEMEVLDKRRQNPISDWGAKQISGSPLPRPGVDGDFGLFNVTMRMKLNLCWLWGLSKRQYPISEIGWQTNSIVPRPDVDGNFGLLFKGMMRPDGIRFRLTWGRSQRGNFQWARWQTNEGCYNSGITNPDSKPIHLKTWTKLLKKVETKCNTSPVSPLVYSVGNAFRWGC